MMRFDAVTQSIKNAYNHKGSDLAACGKCIFLQSYGTQIIPCDDRPKRLLMLVANLHISSHLNLVGMSYFQNTLMKY